MYHLHIILTHSSSPLNIITVYNCKVIYTYFYICIQLHKAYTSFSRDEIQVHFYVKVLSKKKKKVLTQLANLKEQFTQIQTMLV